MAEQVIGGPARKAPGDTLKQAIDFGPDLPTGVTLSSAAATVTAGGGSFAVAASPVVSGSTATASITGGKRGDAYAILVEGTYSDGQVRGFLLPVTVV